MDQRTIQMFFALMRSAIRGTQLTEKERNDYSYGMLQDLVKISVKHDVAHLLVLALNQNKLVQKTNDDVEGNILQAVYRYEQFRYEYENICNTLETACISFLPLKGTVIRKNYPEEWMRTSCDIDILVHRQDLDVAIACLSESLQYTEKKRATHDVSLLSPSGVHVELHFDLVEEDRANNATEVLRFVWENVSLQKNSSYCYVMNDAFFYFYHIAHMAKHFENGGCGIRPFIDLWILDNIEDADFLRRDELLAQGNLLKFAEASRTLSKVWLDGLEADELSCQIQDYILSGGVYGTADNRVALHQTKKGGRLGYIISRVFISYPKLKRYYPILGKYPWLMPFMHIRRWFMMLNPVVAKMARRELTANKTLEKAKADEMSVFLDNIGL